MNTSKSLDDLIDDLVPVHRQDDFRKAITTETTKAVKAERRTPKCTECKKPLYITRHPKCWEKQYKALEQAARQKEQK